VTEVSPSSWLHGSIVLKDADAVAIYLQKSSKDRDRGTAAQCAKQYGITAKAVRDVWNHRTWANQTFRYWTEQERFVPVFSY